MPEQQDAHGTGIHTYLQWPKYKQSFFINQERTILKVWNWLYMKIYSQEIVQNYNHFSYSEMYKKLPIWTHQTPISGLSKLGTKLEC